MDIKKIIEVLNKDYMPDIIDTEIYSKIALWRQWYSGHVKEFHKYMQYINKKKISRKRYGLKIAPKICQDWATILCNNKAQLIIDDDYSNNFVQGNDEMVGIFGDNDFWTQANQLVEKAFALGTAATDIYFENMKITADGLAIKSPDIRPRISYIVADSIIPISWDNGIINEVAFASEVTKDGAKYVYVRMHRLIETGYEITNAYYKGDKDGSLTEVELPEGMLKVFNTGSFVKLFSIWKPNKVNTFDLDSPLGMSIFSDAIDNLEGIDYAYDNLCQDFFLGGKMVFMNGTMFDEDNTAPAYSQDSLFRVMGDAVLEGGAAYHEYNPLLRVQENKDGIQAQLDYLSLMVGFGTKHYQFNAGTITTATQYTGDKQDLIQNASKHNMVVERALTDIVKALLWVGDELMGLPVKQDAKITFIPDQSYIIDEESERLFDLQLVRDGLMAKWEWRVKYKGETEEEARAKIDEIESGGGIDLFGDNKDAFSTSNSTSSTVEKLNGAQTQSLIAIMAQFASKSITEGQAINLISTALGIEKDKATEILKGV